MAFVWRSTRPTSSPAAFLNSVYTCTRPTVLQILCFSFGHKEVMPSVGRVCKSSRQVPALFKRSRPHFYLSHHRWFLSKKLEAYHNLDLSANSSFFTFVVRFANSPDQKFLGALRILHKMSCDMVEKMMLPYFVEEATASIMKDVARTQAYDKAYSLKVFNCAKF